MRARRTRQKEREKGRRTAEEAWNAVAASDLDAAEDLIRKALKGHEGDCVLWNDLGLILWRKGDLKDAEKALRSALLIRPDHEDAKMNLAALLAERGFFRQALRLEEELAASSARREFHARKAEEYRRLAEERSRAGEAGAEPGEEARAGEG